METPWYKTAFWMSALTEQALLHPTYCDIVANDSGLCCSTYAVLGHVDGDVVLNVGIVAHFDAVHIPCVASGAWQASFVQAFAFMGLRTYHHPH